jgi:putative ABC transport system permease protein
MTGSSIGALGLVARRDIARHRLRSALVVALIGLPVAAMVAGISLYRTTTQTTEQSTTGQMGRADLFAVGTTREQLQDYLPAGSRIEPLVSGDGHLVLPGTRPGVSLRGMDIDGLAAGILTLVTGRAPQGADEAAISEPVASLAGVGIGGAIALDDGRAATVVGIVENPRYLDDRVVLVDPATLTGDRTSLMWLVGLPPGNDADAIAQATVDPATGEQQLALYSRRWRGIQIIGDDSTSPTILILGSLALIESALVASAAFAVSIRRRQRELGLLAATGATPRQLAGVVLWEAAALGAVACLAGVVVGLLGVLAISPWLDQLTKHRNPALVVDLFGLVGPVLVGFVAALIAAVIPARTVARVPVLLALSGRRPAQSPARRTLWVGLGVVALAAAMTVIGATVAFAGDSSIRYLLLIGGAVLSTLGFGACAPWLLERLDGLASRLPLSGRIAFRDTARARSRSSPIVTAILAGCAAAIALGAWQTSRDQESLASWVPSLYADQLALDGPDATAVGNILRDETGVLAGTTIPFLAFEDPNVSLNYQLPDARDDSGKVINLADQCSNCTPGAFQPFEVYRAAPATPEVLAMVRAGAYAGDLAAGRAVVLSNRAASASKLEIVVQRDPDDPSSAQRISLPIRLVRVPVGEGTLPGLFLPDATIRELGLIDPAGNPQFGPAPYVLRYDHAVTDADLAHAQDVASRYIDTSPVIDTPPVRQGAEFRILIIGLVLLFAVSVTGVAIALGEAESRPEQRSLLALGADPRLRRRIAASRAAVMALLAGLLAVPAGLLPIWGIFVSRGSELAVPTIEIAGTVLLLPVLAVASAWLLSRPIPDWNAFRNVRPGE